MNSVNKLLQKIFNTSKYQIINRYAVMSQSTTENKRAYYFSTPVFKKSDNKPIKPNFQKYAEYFFYNGSNGTTKIYGDHAVLSNGTVEIHLSWNERKNILMSENGNVLKTQDMVIFPTFNGIAIRQRGNKMKLYIKASKHFDVRSNTKYFAFMKSKFEPIVTFNAMFAENRYRDIFYNTIIRSRKITDTSYEIDVTSDSSDAFQLTYDINLYEPKLIQDTTVESKMPKENNAYGNISFLGKSNCFGTQLLYSRIDVSKMDLPTDLKIDNVKLHIPYYAVNGNDFRISVPIKRFCSFGSNWNNKIPYSNAVLLGTRNNGYITFDISKYVISKTGKWNPNEGFVIQSRGEHFSIIGTGDNYYTPQIIEITFKK